MDFSEKQTREFRDVVRTNIVEKTIAEDRNIVTWTTGTVQGVNNNGADLDVSLGESTTNTINLPNASNTPLPTVGQIAMITKYGSINNALVTHVTDKNN